MKTVQVSKEVHAELKEYCAKRGMKVGAAVEIAVKYWLNTIKSKSTGGEQK